MEQIISKEELNRLGNIKGDTRGNTIKNTAEFILDEEGEEGLKKLEDTMSGLGWPIDYMKIDSMSFYPLNLFGVTLAVIEKLFNYEEEEYRKMGRLRVQTSIIIRIFMRYLVSFDVALKGVPKMWKKSFTVGDIKVAEYDKKKKYVILKLENWHFYPTQCRMMEGLFSTILQIVVGSKTTCEETKCVHKGDECHEFLLKW